MSPSNELKKSKESKLRFLLEFIKHPLRVGSIAPSSESLTDAMMEGLDFEKLEVLFEYGPGTGVFTERILGKLGTNSAEALTVIELEPKFSQVLQKRFPGLKILTQKASEVSPPEGTRVDAIISSLPFTFFPWQETDKTIQHVCHILAPNGVFRTYLYVQSCFLPKNLRLLFLLRSKFKAMKIKVVLFNLPPAAVFTCREPKAA